MSTHWTIRGGYSSVWMNRAAYSLIFVFSTQITPLWRYFYRLLSYASRKKEVTEYTIERGKHDSLSVSAMWASLITKKKRVLKFFQASFLHRGQVYFASTLQASLTWFAPTNRHVSLPTLISAQTLYESKSESDLLKGASQMSKLPAGSHTSQGWEAHSQHLNWSETTLAPQ